MKQKRPILLLLCLLLFLSVFAVGCAGRSEKKYITCLADMADMKIAFGYPDDIDMADRIYEVCPKADPKPQSDILACEAVANGKLGCFAAGKTVLEDYLRQNPGKGLTLLDEPIITFYSALGLNAETPVPDYVSRVDECLRTMIDDGTLEDMNRRWYIEGSDTMPDIELPENPSYTLRVVTIGQQRPSSFLKDNEIVGMDVELAYRVAAYLGCGIRVETAKFSAMLMGISKGTYDMIASDLYVTEDRQENMVFSLPYREAPVGVLVQADPSGKIEYNHLDELQSVDRFGSVTGTVMDSITRAKFPDAEILQYNSVMDEMYALTAGKIDAMLYDEPVLRYICAEHNEVKILPELVETQDYFFVTAKDENGREIANAFNTWLNQEKKNGTLDEMKTFWISTESPEGRISVKQNLSAEKTIRIGYTVSSRPECILYENEPVGYTVEMAIRFCEANNWAYELVPTNIDSFITALQSGRIDLYTGFISYTDERAENVTYTDSVYSGGIAALVRDEKALQADFWTKIKRSFRNTFISEKRWQMILSGLGITMLITLGGFILANLLGALFCALGLSKNRFCLALADIYSRIMQGTPIVVVLMILYYVIFGKSSIDGKWIAMLGFGLATGASLAQLFQGGISAVDRGQQEASLALGFTKTQTFFGITLPQAVRSMLPGYFSALIALLKSTSIVGYIAVIDLTKASDMIRSSTYEAFFPLIAIAVIYFLISNILLSILKLIQKKLAPKRRTGTEVAK